MHIFRIWSEKTKKGCLTPCRLQKRTGNSCQASKETCMMVIWLYLRMDTKKDAEPRRMSGQQSFHILHKIPKVLHKMSDGLSLTCHFFVTNIEEFPQTQKEKNLQKCRFFFVFHCSEIISLINPNLDFIGFSDLLSLTCDFLIELLLKGLNPFDD